MAMRNYVILTKNPRAWGVEPRVECRVATEDEALKVARGIDETCEDTDGLEAWMEVIWNPSKLCEYRIEPVEIGYFKTEEEALEFYREVTGEDL